jgi:hypothetical protein
MRTLPCRALLELAPDVPAAAGVIPAACTARTAATIVEILLFMATSSSSWQLLHLGDQAG